MNYRTLDEIYSANAAVRERFKLTVAGLSEDQTVSPPGAGKWSIAQIVEHVSLVNEGTTRICERLLNKAREGGKTSGGEVSISEDFLQRGAEIEKMKVAAPERVAPVHGQTIAESLRRMEESSRRLAELRPLFERHHSPEFTFSHPFFGDICAQEWLALIGAHEERHLRQIEKLLQDEGEQAQKDPGYEEGEITGA